MRPSATPSYGRAYNGEECSRILTFERLRDTEHGAETICFCGKQISNCDGMDASVNMRLPPPASLAETGD
ncbi:MAG: hypothetical protein ABGZ23_11970, partial [Fuerstiella sp.]